MKRINVTGFEAVGVVYSKGNSENKMIYGG